MGTIRREPALVGWHVLPTGGPARLSRGVTRSKLSRVAKNHRRHRAVHDLAHRKTRLNPRHPRQARKFGAVSAFKIFDVARHDDDDIVVTSRHQEPPDHRRTVDPGSPELFERFLVLAMKRDTAQQ